MEQERTVPLPIRLLFSVAPILVTVALWIPIGLIWGPKALGQLVGFMAAIFVFLGKFAVFTAISEAEPLRPYLVAMLIVYMDTCVACLVAFNLDWLFEVRRIGPRLERLRESSGDILEINPWMRKATFIGVMLFVAFPLTGTGAIGGTLLGRMMGLRKRRILLAILIGACIGSFGLALGAHMIGQHLETLLHNKAITIPATLAILGFFAWLNWMIQSKVKQARVRRETRKLERSAE